MKKLLLILLVFSLVLVGALTQTTGKAAAEQPNDVVIELEQSFSGDELTVIARMNENDGFVSMSLRVEFDKAAFTLESLAHADTLSDMEPTDNLTNVKSGKSDSLYVLYVGYGENNTATGELFTMRFRVKEGATNGKHKVSLFVTELTYKQSGSQEVLFNEKYSEEGASLEEVRNGGALASETEYTVQNGAPAPSFEEEGGRTLVIVLAVVGGALVLAGIVLAAYFAYRKKGDDPADGSIDEKNNNDKKA